MSEAIIATEVEANGHPTEDRSVKIKLDASTVRKMSPPKGDDKELFAWDTELEGFGLRVRKRNDGTIVRTWAVQYRIHGRTRRISLGPLEKLTPTEARKAARKIFGRVANDSDPQAERQAKRRESRQTFRAVVDEYLAAWDGKLRPASLAMTKLYLTGPYFRLLHGMGIGEITRPDVSGCIRAVERKHSTATAATARRHLSTFFAWCLADGLLGSGANPVDGTHRPADPKPRDRVLSDAELVTIWNASAGDDDHSRIVKLLILTGARRGEVGGMCWGEFDPVDNWTLPAARSKNK